MPNTPHATHKKLKVIPLLLKNPTHTQYVIDKAQDPQWPSTDDRYHTDSGDTCRCTLDSSRAKQHIVNEISHALRKVLIFNTNASNPFQTWTQGQWHAQWQKGEDEEHICTMFVCIPVPDYKIKIRIGKNLVWRKTGPTIQDLLNMKSTKGINNMFNNQQLWQEISGIFPPETSSS